MPMTRYLLLVAAALLAMTGVSCEGKFTAGGEDSAADAGDDAPPDTGGEPDSAGDADAPLETDGTEPDGIPDVAEVPLDGPDGDPADPVPDDPCAAVACGDNAHCVSGRCVCDDGFVDVGGVCRTADPGDPESRTEAEACDRWRADYPTTASWVWNEGAGTCDLGEVNDAARNDGVRRINLYRWLVGLLPVTRNVGVEEAQQACAIMMLRNGTLNHSPPSSWECYTAEGAGAAGSSNLAMGSGDPAGAVDQYLQDWGNEDTMGHRRWILYPPYSAAGIGQAGSYNCLNVFSWGSPSSRPWVAFPAPGPYPAQGVLGAWTFSADGVGSSTQVTVTRESDGADLGVTTALMSGSYGQPTVTFDPGEAAAGETYVVTVTGLGGDDVTYRVRIVDCS